MQPLRVMILAALMQDKFGGATLAVAYESDLGINNLEKIHPVAFWKYLYFRLACRLSIAWSASCVTVKMKFGASW